MKTSHIFRLDFIRISIKYTLILSILVSFGFQSQAQCDLTAGPDKIIRYSEFVQLKALPHFKGNWKEHPKVTTNLFTDACYVNDTNIIVVGTQGTILKYNGKNWQTIPTGLSVSIQDVEFYDEMNGIAVGDGDLILKTSDGGNTWNRITSETGYFFTTLHFINAQNLIAGGYKSVAGKPIQSGIFKSTDGGSHWEMIGGFTGSRVTSIDFVNTTLGYACSSNTGVFKTTDGGLNWQKLKVEVFGGYSNFHAIKAVTSQVVFVAGNPGTVIKSEDGGENWMSINPNMVELRSVSDKEMIDIQYAYLESMLCNSAEDVMIAGFLTTPSDQIGIILKWNAEGNYWMEEKVISSAGRRISKLIQNTTGEMMAAGNDGLILTKSPPDQFEWTPTTGLSNLHISDPIASPEVTTTYTVKRTSSGCTATDEVTVYVANSNDNIKSIQCGQSIQLDSVPYPVDFSGAVKYKWTPAKGLDCDTIARPTCNVGEDTKYTATVILNDGHEFIDSVFASTNYVKVDTFSANAGDDVIASPGSLVQLHVSHNYTGNDQVSYKWYPSEGLDNDTSQHPIATVSGEISYTVIVTTSSGCMATDNIRVTSTIFKPLVYQRNLSLTCGSSLEIDSIKTNYAGVGRLRYQWLPAIGLSSDTVPNPVCSVAANTTYKVSIISPEGNSTSCTVVVNVNKITINPINDKIVYCGQQIQLGPVTTNYKGNERLRYKWTPSTGLSNDTIPNPIVTVGDNYYYTITVTTVGGCTGSMNVRLLTQLVPTPSITSVSVDSLHKNRIEWALPNFVYDSIYIYKETNQPNQYSKIGSVGEGISSFIDTHSEPKLMSNSYKISVLDHCGIETRQSSQHKTMHLSINKGVDNSLDLSWVPYVGFSLTTYNIYRGADEHHLSLISSQSGAKTQFSDLNAPTGDIYYQIEAISGITGTIISRSNIAFYQESTGIYNPIDISDEIVLSPNPVRDYVVVTAKSFNGKPLTLTVCNLQGMVLMRTEMTGATQNINLSQLSPGMYLVVVDNERVKGCKKLVKK